MRINEIMYSLQYIFKNRWIASELCAIKNVKKIFRLLVTDLMLISKDSKAFNQETRNIALELHKKLQGKNFLQILHFITDVMEHLNIWSLKMQKRYGLLINVSKFNEKIIQTLTNLKTTNGHDLTYFMHRTWCIMPDERSVRVKCISDDKYFYAFAGRMGH